MNRRSYLNTLLLAVGLLIIAACRPAMIAPLTRQDASTIPPEEEVLLRKAMGYERQMAERHLSAEGLVLYRVREEGPPDINLPDTAIWTGCYVAAEALRWKVTHDPEARERVIRGLKALHDLQQVTGKKGLLARAFRKAAAPSPDENGEWRPGKGDYREYRWLGDVSADQVDGVLFGYALAFDLLDDPSLREQIAEDVAAIADHLLDHRMRIIDIDGKMTRFGDFRAGLFSEDLNALIALMVLKVAHHVTRAPRFEAAYHDLIERSGYDRRAAAARDKWWEHLIGVNHSDNNLAFLAYYPLLRLERAPALQQVYQKGLRRAWRVVRNEANPLFTFIDAALTSEAPPRPDRLAQALETLFFFPSVKRNIPMTYGRRADVCRSFWNDRSGHPQACTPVPIQYRSIDTFEWKANPYRLEGGGDGKTLFAGVDYLLPYWLGRYHQFIHPLQ